MSARRSTGFVAVAAVITLAATALVSVSPAQGAVPEKKHVTLTVTELPGQVRLIPGESVKVRLSTNVTTGYSWSTKVVGKKGAVAVSPGVYAAGTTDLVGAPGTTTWVVTARAHGTAVVTFLKTPPGQDSPLPDGSLTVIVR